MKLTDEIKKGIMVMSYEQLLSRWRFAPSGDPLMQGETGDYWSLRMKGLRDLPGGQEEHVRASKSLGWESSR